MALVEEICYESRLNQSTGVVEKVRVERSYYRKDNNIKKINFKGTFMTYMKALEHTCKSSNDIKMITELLHNSNKRNEIHVNITQFSKDMENKTRLTVINLLKRAVESQLLKKLSAGTYVANPFMFVSVAMNKKNDNIVEAQKEWLDEDN